MAACLQRMPNAAQVRYPFPACMIVHSHLLPLLLSPLHLPPLLLPPLQLPPLLLPPLHLPPLHPPPLHLPPLPPSRYLPAPMPSRTPLLDDRAIGRTLARMASEIVERSGGTDELVLVG